MINKKELGILLTIVTLDLITKILANNYLPFGQQVNVIGNKLSLYLTYNQGATGEQASFLLQAQKDKNIAIILICINGLSLLTYLLIIRKLNLGTIYKVIIGIILYVALTNAAEIIKPILTQYNITSWAASVMGKVTGLIIYGVLFYFTKDKLARLSVILILACGFGNLLSHFYRPFLVIDFIYIDGLYELLRIGIFNFADLSFDVGIVGLIVFLLIWAFRKLTGSTSGK